MHTRRNRMEFIDDREQIIQEKMRTIAEEEYESEVAIMEEGGDYDDDNWNMILGLGGQSNSLSESNVQERALVRKREDNN